MSNPEIPGQRGPLLFPLPGGAGGFISPTVATSSRRTFCTRFAVAVEGKQYVYVWADGVHFNVCLEEDRQCILVLMGATPEGKKELIAVADGYETGSRFAENATAPTV